MQMDRTAERLNRDSLELEIWRRLGPRRLVCGDGRRCEQVSEASLARDLRDRLEGLPSLTDTVLDALWGSIEEMLRRGTCAEAHARQGIHTEVRL